MIATGVGLYAFFQVGKSLQRITEEALPPALAASELSIRAEFIVGVGPALISNKVPAIGGFAQGYVPAIEIRGKKEVRIFWYAVFSWSSRLMM